MPNSVATLFSAQASERRRAEAWIKPRLVRGRSEVFTETVDLTPALAEMLMERNAQNRNLSQKVVNTYATDIAGGRWALNGEALKVSTEGLLNDGQHRCAAVVQAARPIKTLIVFGCQRETRLTLDQGRARTPGDYLSMDGVKDANVMAAVASLVFQMQRYGELLTKGPQMRPHPTKTQTRETLAANPDIIESAKKVPTRNSTLLGGRALLVFCHWVIARQDAEGAEEFMSRLMRGDGLEIGDPIHTLREKLMSPKAKKLMSKNDKALSILKTWELYRQNRRVTRIVTGSSSLKDFA